jgi:Zn-dependent oligopeptidase
MLFEKNGMRSNSLERKQVEELNKKTTFYGAQFDKNLSAWSDSIEYSAEELTGLPENTTSGWKSPNGKFIIYVNNPNANLILKYADSSKTRKEMYLHYYNRGYPKNLQVLDSLYYYRHLLAKILGFKSFAEYTLIDKMAGTPENVWRFEYELIEKLKPQLTLELKELGATKRNIHPNQPDTIFAWDVDFYLNKLLD